MIKDKTQLGLSGEELAGAFLTQNGYKILEKNFRNWVGEIDIIALDGDTLVFIEVKTRKTDAYGSPLEAVTPAKQKKIARVALSYMKYKNKIDVKARFDVVGVMLEGAHCRDIDIIQNAFELN